MKRSTYTETLTNFEFSQTKATLLYEDNLACVAMSENQVRQKFSRHIDIRKYYVRELVLNGFLKIVSLRSCLHFITLGVKVLSSHLPAPDAPDCADDVLRTRLAVLQLERSSADVALAFLQRSTLCVRALICARLQGPEGFFFAGSIDGKQGQRKPSRTSGLLFLRAASARRNFTASLQGPAGFFFTSSLTGGWMRRRRMC